MPLPAGRWPSDRFRVWLFAVGTESAIATWVERRHELGAEERAEFSTGLVTLLVKDYGREWMRSRVLIWWASTDLLEEEREAIVTALADTRALTRDLLVQLGPAAARVQAMSSARGEPLVPSPAATPWSFAGSKVPSYAVDRLNELIQVITLETNLRDGAFRPAELAMMGTFNRGLNPRVLLGAALERLRHGHPLVDEIAEMLRSVVERDTSVGASVDGTAFAVPTIRVLHMRMVLDAPALAKALERPEEHLIPEVLLYALGRDSVVYSPTFVSWLPAIEDGERNGPSHAVRHSPSSSWRARSTLT